MLPGIVGLTLLTDRLMAVLVEPRLWNVFLLLGLVLIVGLGGYFLKKRLNKPDS
jgi:LPXTG-motif cell wall-anchored protein